MKHKGGSLIWCNCAFYQKKHTHTKKRPLERTVSSDYKSSQESILRNQMCGNSDFGLLISRIAKNKLLLFKPPTCGYFWWPPLLYILILITAIISTTEKSLFPVNLNLIHMLSCKISLMFGFFPKCNFITFKYLISDWCFKWHFVRFVSVSSYLICVMFRVWSPGREMSYTI